jgi:hypothetical protein
MLINADPAITALKQQIVAHRKAVAWHRSRVKFAKDQLNKLRKALSYAR